MKSLMEYERNELRKLTDRELNAYRNICLMSSTCIMSDASRAKNKRHLAIVEDLLEERN